MSIQRDFGRIGRRPISRLPYSTTEPNHERLPKPEHLKAMALAFREQELTATEREARTTAVALSFLFLSVFGTAAALTRPEALPRLLSTVESIHGLSVISGTVSVLVVGL